jgi:hypothetical protein
MQTILVLDFGSQTSHLILRRLRSLKVYAEMLPCTTKLADLPFKPKGIVLSGGECFGDQLNFTPIIRNFLQDNDLHKDILVTNSLQAQRRCTTKAHRVSSVRSHRALLFQANLVILKTSIPLFSISAFLFSASATAARNLLGGLTPVTSLAARCENMATPTSTLTTLETRMSIASLPESETRCKVKKAIFVCRRCKIAYSQPLKSIHEPP